MTIVAIRPEISWKPRLADSAARSAAEKRAARRALKPRLTLGEFRELVSQHQTALKLAECIRVRLQDARAVMSRRGNDWHKRVKPVRRQEAEVKSLLDQLSKLSADALRQINLPELRALAAELSQEVDGLEELLTRRREAKQKQAARHAANKAARAAANRLQATGSTQPKKKK